MSELGEAIVTAGDSSWLSRPGASLRGEFEVPGDKSISHRALLLGAIADAPVVIRGLLEGEDCRATRRALAALGAELEQSLSSLPTTGEEGPPAARLLSHLQPAGTMPITAAWTQTTQPLRPSEKRVDQ